MADVIGGWSVRDARPVGLGFVSEDENLGAVYRLLV
jgi:hypothetical protein